LNEGQGHQTQFWNRPRKGKSSLEPLALLS
jgi:hypothetical protein